MSSTIKIIERATAYTGSITVTHYYEAWCQACGWRHEAHRHNPRDAESDVYGVARQHAGKHVDAGDPKPRLVPVTMGPGITEDL